jgi:hypothetical protein
LELVRTQCEDTDKAIFCAAGSLPLQPGNAFPDPDQGALRSTDIQPPKPIDGYICTAEGSVKTVSIDDGPSGEPIEVTQAAKFDLNDVLDRDAPTTERAKEYTIPPGQLASPDLFKCHLIPNLPSTRSAEDLDHQIDVLSTPRTTNDFSCEFAENQQTCVFTMHELVPTNVDEVDDDTARLSRKISTAGRSPGDLPRMRSTGLTTCTSPLRATQCPSRCLQVRMLPARVRRPGSLVWCWPRVGRWWEASLLRAAASSNDS